MLAHHLAFYEYHNNTRQNNTLLKTHGTLMNNSSNLHLRQTTFYVDIDTSISYIKFIRQMRIFIGYLPIMFSDVGIGNPYSDVMR